MQKYKCSAPKSIRPTDFSPGDVVTIRYPMYKHFAIVSDKTSTLNGTGLPNLISLSYRTGTVQEEPWQLVAGNKVVEKSTIAGTKEPRAILSRARTCIKLNIEYDLLKFNCEHFVRYVYGLPVESIQVKNTLYGATLGAASCLLLPKVTAMRFAFLVAAGAVMNLQKSLNKV